MGESEGEAVLESIDLSAPKISKELYKARFDTLMTRLISLQQEAKKNGVGMVVLFEGWKGAGKGSRISDILYYLDARDTSVYVTEDFDEEEASLVRDETFGATGYFPSMQQFWKALGCRGGMTFYDRGWYSTIAQHLINRLSAKKVKKKEATLARNDFARAIDSIESFESQLVADEYLVVKFFLHISEDTQRERLTKLYEDPATRWRVSEKDMKQLDLYKQTYKIYDRLLSESHFGSSEWVLLNAEDRRRVNLQVAQTLVNVLSREVRKGKDAFAQVAAEKAQANSAAPAREEEGDERTRTPEENARCRETSVVRARRASLLAPRSSRFAIDPDYPRLEAVDHGLVLDKADYKKQLKAEQERLRRQELQMYINRIPMVIMFEGWDAAGKGGAIKRVAQALDARAYTIFPSPAPTKLELAHPHLWRYWTRLPKAGHVGIYDRSWYGRVLVERVEGFAGPLQWARAYDEINEFERDLVDWGAILLKFWVDVSPEEQLTRFQAREDNVRKRWKITAEDWRNRDKYPEYYAAIEDMFRLTSTVAAPWTLLESDNKYYARVKALRIINERLEERLKEF